MPHRYMELPNIKWIISVMFLSTTNRYWYRICDGAREARAGGRFTAFPVRTDQQTCVTRVDVLALATT